MSISYITGSIGRKALHATDHLLNLMAFTFRLLRIVRTRRRSGRALVRKVIIEQIYFTAVQALPIIIPIALLIGCMIIVQFARFGGQVELGKAVVLLIVRETGPMITALLVILRSATAVTIEISYMKVFHEFDAMEMTGLDPMRMVCIPRLVGISFAVVGLFIIFTLVSILGGYVLVGVFTHINVSGFLHQIAKALTLSDIIVGVTKAFLFGITITVTCLYFGLRIGRRITEIPLTTSWAAIRSFFYCLVINIFISTLFYL